MMLRALPQKVRRAFLLDGASAIVVGMLNGATAPFWGIIARKDLQAGPLAISLLSAAPLAGFLLTALWVKRAEQGHKVRQIVGLNLIARLLLLLLVFSHGAGSFITILSLSMIIPALSYPAYIGLLKAVYPEAWRGRLTSLVKFAAALSNMGSAALVGYLLGLWSYRWIFPAASALSLVGLFVFSFIPEPEKQPIEGEPPSLKNIFLLLRQDQLFAYFTLAFFVFSVGVRMITPVVTLLQVDELHITVQWAGALTTVNILVMALTYYFWGRVADLRGAFICLLLAMAGFTLMALGYLVVPSLPWLLPVIVIGGLASSAHEVGMLNSLMTFGRHHQMPRYTGVHFTILGLVGLGAPLLGGLLAEKIPLRVIFVLSAILMLAGFFLMRNLMKKLKMAQLATS